MPSVRSKKICKICPNRKKPIEIQKSEESKEETNNEIIEDVEVVEEEEIVEIEESCVDLSSYGDFELVTPGQVLEETKPDGRKKKPAFFASPSEKTRYENLIPCDVTNDHQYEASRQKNPTSQMSALRVTSEPRTKRLPAIVATISRSCVEPEKLEELILSGMNIARINLAHGDRCFHLAAIANIKEADKRFSAKIGFRSPTAVMLDLKGSLITTGRICKLYIKDCENPRILLEKGRQVKLTFDKKMADKCTPNTIYVDCENLWKIVRPGMKVVLDDGAVKLVVIKIEKSDVYCEVEEEGYLGNNGNVHIPMLPLTLPAYTEKDVEDIGMAIDEGIDAIVLPRARHPVVIRDIREKLTEKLLIDKEKKERPIMIFAKISNFEGLSNIDGLIEESDGIVVQRGDLGMELPPEKVFIAEKEIVAKCNVAGKPVLCTTQFLHSMLNKIQVGRSDVADIAACVRDGADCIALTHETAAGKYPAECVELAHHVIREADAASYQNHYLTCAAETVSRHSDPKVAVAIAACMLAEKIRAPAIIVLTTSGKSAKLISQLRPRAAVIAVTAYERTARQLNFWRCVIPLYCPLPCTTDWFMDAEKKFMYGIAYGKEFGFVRAGDPVVLVSAYGKEVGFTNCVRIVYASTQPTVYTAHSKEFFPNPQLWQNPCAAPLTGRRKLTPSNIVQI